MWKRILVIQLGRPVSSFDIAGRICRVFKIWFLAWVYGPDIDALGHDFMLHGRKLAVAGPYAVCMAWINGLTPMMLMTRFRL